MRWTTALLGCVLAVGCESGNANRGGNTPVQPNNRTPPQRQPSTQASPDNPVVASVEGAQVTREQLMRPLLQSHGLPILLNLVQLEMARAEAAKMRLTVSPADVQAEQDRTLKRMFRDASVVGPGGEPGKPASDEVDPSEYATLLEQFLQRRNMSQAEWDLLMQINATLRKLAEPRARGAISDDQLGEAFRQLYGEKVQVLHIQCSNMTEIGEVRRRLQAGEAFEDVARALSRNARTAPLGGELPPFTRQSAFPEQFKTAAFTLQPGQVSDPVQADNAYHLIKLVRRIEPTAIKFEDVKNSLREDLEERLIAQFVAEIRADLSARAQRGLKIVEPTLKTQFDAEQARRADAAADREAMRRDLERQRQAAATQQGLLDLPPAPGETPATQPTTQPSE